MNHVERLALLVLGALYLSCGQQEAARYAPRIDPTDFTTRITNPYFSLPAGKTFTYDGQVSEGAEHVEIAITNDTRTIMGVATRLYHDQVCSSNRR